MDLLSVCVTFVRLDNGDGHHDDIGNMIVMI